MLPLAAGALEATPLSVAPLALGASRFALTGLYQLTGSVPVETAAGWAGIPLVGFSLYGARGVRRQL